MPSTHDPTELPMHSGGVVGLQLASGIPASGGNVGKIIPTETLERHDPVLGSQVVPSGHMTPVHAPPKTISSSATRSTGISKTRTVRESSSTSWLPFHTLAVIATDAVGSPFDTIAMLVGSVHSSGIRRG